MQLSLLQNSEMHALRERAEAIVWIRTQMARFGIHFENLQEAGCFQPRQDNQSAASATLYRDAQGQTWDGRGDLPSWLQRAVNAGQSIEHFRVEAAS
ncbi:H-NS histone family protein [Cupriavidus pauculus]|uniref:H-NS histone family protein n=1 Tax=Cupriavidus TaxID=106589 RepID=UPI001D0CA2DE|nr:H-NS family nucleoid-associated regulatory protein [Cupriavidus pauculus]MCM3609494.1 H-NS histone family protein [Cupriavidus pauculus]